MKTVSLAAILLTVLAFAIVGCGKKTSPPTPPGQPETPSGMPAQVESTAGSMAEQLQKSAGAAAENVNEQPAAATGAAAQAFTSARDQFVATMQTQLSDLSTRITDLQSRPAPSGTSQSSWDSTKAKLSEELTKVQNELANLNMATASNWNDVKDRFTKLMDNLKSDYNDAARTLEKAAPVESTAPQPAAVQST